MNLGRWNALSTNRFVQSARPPGVGALTRYVFGTIQSCCYTLGLSISGDRHIDAVRECIENAYYASSHQLMMDAH